MLAGLSILPAPAGATPGGEECARAAAAAQERRPVATGGPQLSDYRVHEWGTFTSVLAPDGRALSWNPFQFFAPLPGFVHRSEEFKPSYWGTVRMETPVLYFYAER